MGVYDKDDFVFGWFRNGSIKYYRCKSAQSKWATHSQQVHGMKTIMIVRTYYVSQIIIVILLLLCCKLYYPVLYYSHGHLHHHHQSRRLTEGLYYSVETERDVYETVLYLIIKDINKV